MQKLIPFLFFLTIFGCKSEEERITEKANTIEKEILFARGQSQKESTLAEQCLELSKIAKLNGDSELADSLLSMGTFHLSNSYMWIGKVDSLITECKVLLKEVEQLD